MLARGLAVVRARVLLGCGGAAFYKYAIHWETLEIMMFSLFTWLLIFLEDDTLNFGLDARIYNEPSLALS
jgi:hypothetical protein